MIDGDDYAAWDECVACTSQPNSLPPCSCHHTPCVHDKNKARIQYLRPLTFEEVWKEMEKAGYDYGEDALQGVRFGWELYKRYG